MKWFLPVIFVSDMKSSCHNRSDSFRKTTCLCRNCKRINGEIISADSRQIYNTSRLQPVIRLDELNSFKHYFMASSGNPNSGEFGKEEKLQRKNFFQKADNRWLWTWKRSVYPIFTRRFFEDEINSKEIREETLWQTGEFRWKVLYDELKQKDEITYKKIPER